MKKKSVVHSMLESAFSRSTRVTSRPTAAPVRATVAGSTWSAWWAKKASTVSTSTGPVRRSSAESRIEAARVELHHRPAVALLDLQPAAEDEVEQRHRRQRR